MRRKEYVVYSPVEGGITELERAWQEKLFNEEMHLVVCNKKEETVENQRRIISNYHCGKTNHRGVIETLAWLENYGYWLGMRRTIEEYNCKACCAVRDRIPLKTQKMLTSTSEGTGKVVEVDVFFFKKLGVLTIIDIFSKQVR